MDVSKRIALIRTIAKIENNKAFSKKLGISNKTQLRSYAERSAKDETCCCRSGNE